MPHTAHWAAAIDRITAAAGHAGTLLLNPLPHAGDKIRLTDQTSTEGHKGESCCQHLFRRGAGKDPAHRDQGQSYALSGRQRLLEVKGLLYPRTGRKIYAADLHAVHSRPLIPLQQPVQIAAAVGVRLDQHGKIRAAGRPNGLQDPAGQPEAVFQGAAVLVGPVIFPGIQKIRQQVAVGVVDLYPVQPGLPAYPGRGAE